MKFFINYYDNVLNRPSYKFFLNLFFLKNNAYFSIKQLSFIHTFYSIKKLLKIRFFKFNYSYYNNFIFYFLIVNIFIQSALYFI